MDRQNGILAVPKIVRILAGLETGVIGAAVVLLWFIFLATRQDQVWYAMPNLLGSTFYGNAAFRAGFGLVTLSGIAIHVLASGLAASIYALLVPLRLSGARSFLLALIAGMLWFYITHYFLWPILNPLVQVYTTEASVLAGNLLFGMCLARTPRRIRSLRRQLGREKRVTELETNEAPVITAEDGQSVAGDRVPDSAEERRHPNHGEAARDLHSDSGNSLK